MTGMGAPTAKPPLPGEPACAAGSTELRLARARAKLQDFSEPEALARFDAARSFWRRAMASAPPSDPVPLGSQLRGRYTLIEVIGRGGLATVYRAVDRMRQLARCPDPHVAIKAVRAEGELATWLIETVHREARVLRALDHHPNIVRVFDSDADGDVHFAVLELLSGETLGTLLKAASPQGLPQGRALRIVGAVASALAHAHRHGILHGDVKPNNVFLTSEGGIKLFDFGAAQAFGAADDAQDFDAVTPLYASIERLAGARPEPSDDLYALGVLTFAMIAGRHPFGGVSAAEAQRLGLSPERPEGLSHHQWRALRAALAFERRRRAASVEDFARILCRRPLIARLLGPRAPQ